MKFKRSMYNIMIGFGSQVVILTLGIVIPRLFIMNYGSEVNGLYSSINQIFTYVALLEAGVGAATIQALYRPIVKNERDNISKVLSATKYYYKRISFWYFFCVICISIIFPYVMISTIAVWKVMVIIFLQGLSGVINFYFQATLKQLISAEGKDYVNSNIAMLVSVMTSVGKIVLITIFADIVLIQVVYLFISIIQMLFYHYYFKNNYKWVDLKVSPDFDAIKQKNSFLVHQISLLIFSSTDVLVLSLFCGFKIVSVYAVYNMVMTSLNALVNTLYNSVAFTLGHTFHEDKKRYLKLHDAIDTYYTAFIFGTFSVCYILFTPFILLYTRGITDIEYANNYLPFLFCVIQLLTSARMVSNNLIRIAGHIKQTIPRSLVEAGINIVVSLILVKFVGIYGVLIGTIVALLYRTNDIIIYANTRILKRKPIRTYKTLVINIILFYIIILVSKHVNLSIVSYTSFTIKGFIVAIVIIPVYFIINTLADLSSFIFIKNIIIDRWHQFRKTY